MPLTFQLSLTVAVTAIGASFQFYNFGVVNNAQSILETWINSTYATRNGAGLSSNGLTILWSFVVGLFPIGGLVGSFMTRAVAEKLGRRNGLLLSGGFVIGGITCEALAKPLAAPELLMMGRFVTGINSGLNCGLVPLYLTEIAPLNHRGAAGTAHQIAIAFGDWFGFFMTLPVILGTEDYWPYAVCFSLPPAVLLCCLLPFSPKSSKYLLSMGHHKQSKRNLAMFLGEERAESAFAQLVKEALAAAERKKQEKDVGLGNLFRERHLRVPTFIAIAVMIGQQFTGIAAIFAYSSDIFQQAGLSKTVSAYCTVGIGIGYFLCTLPSPILIERWGRRALELCQLAGCMTSLIFLSIFLSLRINYGMSWASYVCIATLVTFMCFYGAGAPIPWLIASELFDQKYRSLAVSIGVFVSFLGAFFVSIFYLPFQRAVNPSLSFIPFIVVTFLVLIGMAIFLPETKNRNIEDIMKDFQTRKRNASGAIASRITSRIQSAAQDEDSSLLDDDNSPDYGSEQNDL